MNDCVTVPGCTLCKGKLVCVLNQTRPHKDVWGSGGTLHIFLTLVQDWAECMLKSLYPWGKKTFLHIGCKTGWNTDPVWSKRWKRISLCREKESGLKTVLCLLSYMCVLRVQWRNV